MNEPDPSDRRAALLFLTPKAEPILEDMRAHARDAGSERAGGNRAPDAEGDCLPRGE